MTFPATPLPIVGKFLIDGVWTDVTSSIRGAGDIHITRPRENEQSRTSASTCNFTLNNRDGQFSNRNPMSTYYGKLTRNTQCQFSVDLDGTNIAGNTTLTDSFTRTVSPGWGDATSGETWETLASGGVILGTDFTTNGTEGIHSVPANSAYRYARLNVDIKDFDTYLTFKVPQATGASLEPANILLQGTTDHRYLMVRVEVTTSNTVVIVVIDHLSTEVGRVTVSGLTHTGTGQPLRLRARVTGEVVQAKVWVASTTEPDAWHIETSNPYPTSGFVGIRSGIAASNTNAKPVTFTYDNFSATPTCIRYTGELSTLPQTWDSTGRDVYIPIQASGIIRRLTANAPVLRSPLYRYLSAFNPAGYWPMEDGLSATRISAASVATKAAIIIGSVSPGTDDDLLGSGGIVTIDDDVSGVVGNPRILPTTGIASAVMYFKLPAVPVSNTPILTLQGEGTARRVVIIAGTAGYRFTFYDAENNIMVNDVYAYGGGAEPNQWIAMYIQFVDDGGPNVDWQATWYAINSGNFYTTTPASYTGVPGRFNRWFFGGAAVNNGSKYAHLAILQSEIPLDTGVFTSAANGWSRERAGVRMQRLCAEEGVPFYFRGLLSDSEQMGRQGIHSFMDLAYECADTDGGMLSEPRGAIGITYRCRSDLYNQTGLELDYTANHLSRELQPTEDDQLVVNDVTAERPFGGSGRYVKEEGDLSIQEPPNGISRVGGRITVNPNTDSRLDDLAAQAVFLGTWDDPRYSGVTVELHRNPFLASGSLSRAVYNTEIGDYISITNLPLWLPPEDAELLVQGYKEKLGTFNWDFVYNTSPYGPYYATLLGDGTVYDSRLDATDSTLTSSITSSATSFQVTTPDPYPLWVLSATKPAEFPMLIKIGGESMSVGALSGGTSPQTFSSITRSVNGVVKAHDAGTQVRVLYPLYLSL